MFTFEVPFNGIFAPTYRSRMSNIFRDSESLGKSNGNGTRMSPNHLACFTLFSVNGFNMLSSKKTVTSENEWSRLLTIYRVFHSPADELHPNVFHSHYTSYSVTVNDPLN